MVGNPGIKVLTFGKGQVRYEVSGQRVRLDSRIPDNRASIIMKQSGRMIPALASIKKELARWR